MDDKKLLGRRGEELASKFLQKQGYRIIERNFQRRYGEIDIVAIDPSPDSGEVTLVFVEVKTRCVGDFVSPEESVTPWKLRVLKRSAQYYKMLHPEFPELLRIDFVGVEFGFEGKLENIKLIKNIAE